MRLWPNTNSAPSARLSKLANAWANLAPLTWTLVDWPVSLRTPAKARRSLSSLPTSKSSERPRDKSSVCEGVNSWSFRSVAMLGAEGSPADWRLFPILARRNSQGHYVEQHVIQSLLGMKFNLVGDSIAWIPSTGHGGCLRVSHGDG